MVSVVVVMTGGIARRRPTGRQAACNGVGRVSDMRAEQPAGAIAVARSDGVQDVLVFGDGLLPAILQPQREEADLLGAVQQRRMDVGQHRVAAGLDDEPMDASVGGKVALPLSRPVIAHDVRLQGRQFL